jgi:hypothetical protein
VEARNHVQDRAARLIRDDLPRGERAAVAHPLELVEHRLMLVTRADEVRVQRLGPVRRVDRQAGRAKRLRHDLPSVQPSPTENRAAAEERVGLDLLEREQ